MDYFDKEKGFKAPPDNIPLTHLEDNPFVDSDGKTFLPSIFTEDEEKKFEIDYDWTREGYSSLEDSVAHIYHYEIADEYNYVITQLSSEDLYWLKFIGRFKSVQKLQLDRQTALYPKVLNRKQEKRSLNELFSFGLIWKWSFKRAFLDKPVKVYTLSSNGYRFLEYFFSKERTYFNPQNYFRLDQKYHIRFWETVDLYQLLLSLPIYRGFETYFNLGGINLKNGKKKNLFSPLQEALEIFPNQVKNFVFFTALQSDNDDYYKKAINRWAVFTENGKNLSKDVLSLSGNQNVLAFYAPTVSVAERLNKNLSLPEFGFPILLLIGSVIQKDGITQAFYHPDHANKTLDLQRMVLPNLVDEGDNDE